MKIPDVVCSYLEATHPACFREVRLTPRLYIVDGSVVPSPPGVKPQMTTMALAHRAADDATRPVRRGGPSARPAYRSLTDAFLGTPSM